MKKRLIEKLLEENKIRVIEIKDENEKITLEENEHLLKIRDNSYNGEEINLGFMCKTTKDKKIPKGFLSWYGDNLDKKDKKSLGTIFVITEEYRTGWEMLWIREGMSTAWVKCKHPFGFMIEINSDAFSEIISKIEINRGKISTPIYFDGNTKNSRLLSL